MKISTTEVRALFLPSAFVDTKAEAVALTNMAQKFFGGLTRAEPLYAAIDYDSGTDEISLERID